jgi:hypothetical protein
MALVALKKKRIPKNCFVLKLVVELEIVAIHAKKNATVAMLVQQLDVMKLFQ